MLYHLLYPLHTQFAVFNVTRYITFRTAAASLSALVIGLLLGPVMIRKLRDFQIGQVIRQDGPATHRAKAGTPTMGGLLILTSALVPTLLWADLTNPFVWIAVLRRSRSGASASSTTISRSSGVPITDCCRATRWAGRSSPRLRWVFHS